MIIRDVDEAAFDTETDIVIVGGGACGLVASIAAREHDAVEVQLFEKEPALGGAAKLSSGSLVGAGTRLQADRGIDDDPAQLAEDVLAAASGAGDAALTRVVADESGATVDWLIDDIGIPMALLPEPRTGHSVPRSHVPLDDNGDPILSGAVTVEKLTEAAEDRDVDIHTGSPIDQLVVDDGAVVGVATNAIRIPGGTSERRMIRAKEVVLATGDFSANVCLRTRYLPETMDLVHWGAPGNTGDAIHWGRQLGAKINEARITYYSNPFATQPEEAYLPSTLTESGALLVNRNGERFIDEAQATHAHFGPAIQEQPGGTAFLLFDQPIFDIVIASEGRRKLENAVANGALASAETPKALTRDLGLDAGSLDPDVASNLSGSTVYGTRIRPTIPETRGGVSITGAGRVVSEDGSTIPNLYAGGSACQGLSGTEPTTYLPGNGLMLAFNLGKIIGRAAAAGVGA